MNLKLQFQASRVYCRIINTQITHAIVIDDSHESGLPKFNCSIRITPRFSVCRFHFAFKRRITKGTRHKAFVSRYKKKKIVSLVGKKGVTFRTCKISRKYRAQTRVRFVTIILRL